MSGSYSLIVRNQGRKLIQARDLRFNHKRNQLADRVLKNINSSISEISEVLKYIQDKSYVKGVRLKISTEYDYPVLAYGEFDLKHFFDKIDQIKLFTGRLNIFDHFIIRPIIINNQVIGYLMIDYNRHSIPGEFVNIINDYANILSRYLELDLKYDKVHQEVLEVEHKNKMIQRIQRRNQAFLSMITHDLKSPLQAVSGYLQMLQKIDDKQNTTIEYDHACKQMEYGINEMSRLVNQINEMISYSQGHLSLNRIKVELNWLIEEVVSFMKSFANNRKKNLRFITAPESIFIETDIDKLKRIIENLISNAIKYTTRNGHITIRVEKQKGEARISVEDDGVGIPKDRIKSIFKPFKTFNKDDLSLDRFSSMGMGLYNCSLFSRLLGGRLSVKNNENNGSVFYLYHPICDDQIKL